VSSSVGGTLVTDGDAGSVGDAGCSVLPEGKLHPANAIAQSKIIGIAYLRINLSSWLRKRISV
jgi:hypothetical protein